MKALVYYRSVGRYLLAKGLNRFWPRTFFAGVAPLKMQEMEFSPPGPDWVVLRPRLCGICGSDLRLLKGAESFLLEPYASMPAVLGHEVVAEVVEAPGRRRGGPAPRPPGPPPSPSKPSSRCSGLLLTAHGQWQPEEARQDAFP
jgi:hypothetical protein